MDRKITKLRAVLGKIQDEIKRQETDRATILGEFVTEHCPYKVGAITKVPGDAPCNPGRMVQVSGCKLEGGLERPFRWAITGWLLNDNAETTLSSTTFRVYIKGER